MAGEILQQLVELSRYVGNPTRGYAILGEGNTSARIDDDAFYVKASGGVLGEIDESGFVAVSASKVTAILDDDSAGDEDVTRVLREAVLDKDDPRRPSVEAMLHAILLQVPEYAFIAHTHPTHTCALLCSQKAQETLAGRIYPDHIVCMGHKSLFVPYVDPGLILAREVRKRFLQFVETEGVLPKAIMLQNHGLIAMGDSPKTVRSCTDMAEKTAQILVEAYAVGGPRFMSPEDVERIFTRPDELYRIKALSQ